MHKYKYIFVSIFTILSCCCHASVKTNYVYVISNIYNQVFTENVVTQKVKNTHVNYYFTNNVTTINKIYNATYKTNVSVNCDVSDQYVIAASNQANRASDFASSASSFAGTAASSASTAGSHASSAAASADNAAYQRTQAASECESALATINARINWFDEHSGETITQINSNFTFVVNIQDNSFGFTNVVGVTSFLDTMSNMFMSAANGFPRAYVSPTGKTYSNIIYYDRATANGKVEIYHVNNGQASTVYRYSPNGYTPEYNEYWIVEPAYISTDVNGLRLNYLPTQTNAVPDNYTCFPGSNTLILKEFYWQDGAIQVVIDAYSYSSGGIKTWKGRLRLKHTDAGGNWTYPGAMYANYSGDNGNYRVMTTVSYDGDYNYSLSTTRGWLKTEYQRVLPQGQALWFPEFATPSQQVVIDWLTTWPTE